MIEFAAALGLGQALNFFGAQQAAFASNGAVNAQNNANLLGAWSQGQTNALNERLTREAWAREDKAVQRRVADLKAAGLSPVLAAGSAAQSSGPIPMGSFKPESAGSLKMQKAQMTQQMVQNVAQTIAGTAAAYHQVRLLDSQATTAEAKSALAGAFAKAELEEMRQRTSSAKTRQWIDSLDAQYMKDHQRKMGEESLVGKELKDILKIMLGQDKDVEDMIKKTPNPFKREVTKEEQDAYDKRNREHHEWINMSPAERRRIIEAEERRR